MKKGIFVSYYLKKLLPHPSMKRFEVLRVVRFSVLIIMLMIPLILSLIFAEGMIDGITLKYILLQDGHIQLFHNEPLDKNDLPPSLQESIYSIDFVSGGNGVIYFEKNNREVLFKGVQDSYFNELRRSEFTLTSHSPLQDSSSHFARVYISRELSQHLEVEVGDKVAIITLPSSQKMKVRPSLATVVGLYESGYQKIDESLIFIDREHATNLFVDSGKSEIIVRQQDKERVDSIARTLIDSYDIDVRYATYNEFNKAVYQNFITSRQVILFVFFVILLISGLYIANIAHELVEDSKQSIAMLKVLGATNGQLIASFFLSIIILTTISIIIGVSLGILLSSHVTYFLSLLQKSSLVGLEFYLLDFDIIIPYLDIFFICIAYIIIATLFVLISLRQIVKISVVEVLQQD